MGLANIDPHSHKVQTKLYQIPNVSKIQPFKNVKIYKEMYGHPDAVQHSVRIAIHFFVNFMTGRKNRALQVPPVAPYKALETLLNRCISVKTSLINTKLGNLVNLGVLFLTM